MLFHKSPEEVSKHWLEEVVSSYDASVKRGYIYFGNDLIIGTSFIQFFGESLCLEGVPRSWDGEIPFDDVLLACFYTATRNAGCMDIRGKCTFCYRCKIAKKIRAYLAARKETILDGRGRDTQDH